jgi:hypothetical protein
VGWIEKYLVKHFQRFFGTRDPIEMPDTIRGDRTRERLRHHLGMVDENIRDWIGSTVVSNCEHELAHTLFLVQTN